VGRIWIFPGSDRKLGSGYVYFFINAGLGLAANIALFALFTELAGMNYLIARIVASLFAGLAMFASNALFNFKAL
jgi:putative flippase GtrA